MKKLLVVLIVLLSMNVFASDFGFKGGLNYSLFNGNTEEKNIFEDSFGFTIGGFYNLRFNTFLSLQTEVLLTKDSYPAFNSGEISNTVNILNIKIPLLLNITTKYINVYGGAFYSRIIFDELESKNGYVYDKDNFGIIIGLFYNITENIFIDSRVYLGGNIKADAGGFNPAGSDEGIYHTNFELSLGYSF